MLVRHASKARAARPSAPVADLLESVSEKDLRNWVKWFSVPRHFLGQPEVNRETAETLVGLFKDWGYEVSLQGPYYNVIARPKADVGPLQIVAAHFDSTAFTPGADDNASAMAAMLGCAKAMAGARPKTPVMFISFNREEDGLLGSQHYVAQLGAADRRRIQCAHVLEMVGFASDEPNSQKIPPGLPVKAPTTGNFLGLLANAKSGRHMDGVLKNAKSYLPEFPTLGLHVLLGFEKYLPVLQRSDHAPFWRVRIPSVMWTDMSEFRNPHYHLATDTPETLNYLFLRRVTQLLVATAMTS